MLPTTRRKIEQDRRKAVVAAEATDGYREGTFRHTFDGALCRVEVSFYPRRRWFVSALDDKGNESNRRPLTAQIWKRLEPAIKL